MVMTRFEGFAFLCNVDESIMKLSLPSGYVLEELFMKEFENNRLLDIFQGSSIIGIMQEFRKKRILNKNSVYLVHSTESWDSDSQLQGFDYLYTMAGKMSVIGERFDQLKFFHEGDVRVPICNIRSERYPGFNTIDIEGYISTEKLSLANNEIETISTLMQSDAEFPTNPSLVGVCSYFKQSYSQPYIELQFLTAMVCMEMLFNPSETEIRHRVSRNCAVFLGRDKDESKSIFSEVKKCYDLRSSFVHSGDKGKITYENVRYVRDLLRRSLQKMDSMRKNSKQSLLEKIDCLGFGDGNSIE